MTIMRAQPTKTECPPNGDASTLRSSCLCCNAMRSTVMGITMIAPVVSAELATVTGEVSAHALHVPAVAAVAAWVAVLLGHIVIPRTLQPVAVATPNGEPARDTGRVLKPADHPRHSRPRDPPTA